ncbi:MAG: hypothetical protein Ct9H300mP2_2180 [Candidatus Neomarinimicrobiota bacterium]|nr:MAG: hypothetical protein Ct9H300mP2_2180 [Candidatus Neomarinimicrobiota bacterium]
MIFHLVANPHGRRTIWNREITVISHEEYQIQSQSPEISPEIILNIFLFLGGIYVEWGLVLPLIHEKLHPYFFHVHGVKII